MDFDQIVRNILFENEATGGQTTEDQQEKLYRDGLAAYVTSKFSELQTIFTVHYGSSNKFIVNSDIIPLVSDVTYGAGKTRTGGYDKDKIEQIFPLYDFIAYLYQSFFKGKLQPQDTVLDEAFENFKKTLQSSSKIPLEFPAMSSWGKNIKEDYTQLSKQEIGKIKFEGLDEGMSFWSTIKTLLESYEKTKLISAPKWMDALRYKGITSIEKIFSDPNIARQGKFVFSNEQLDSLYDSLSKQTIINVAITAYRLYEHQIRSNVTDGERIEKLQKDSETFKRFMGSGLGNKAQEMFWSENNPMIVGAGDGSMIRGRIRENLSFNETFEMLNRHLLIGEMGAMEDAVAADAARRATPAATGAAVAADAATGATPAAPVSQFAGSKPGMFMYNLKNLKKTTQIPQVTSFVKALQDLANKLKKGTEGRMDSALDVIDNLSLGVKTW